MTISNPDIGLTIEVLRGATGRYQLLLICMQSGAGILAKRTFESERDAVSQAHFALFHKHEARS